MPIKIQRTLDELAQLEALARAARETESEPTINPRHQPGDERRARGVPIVGMRGVGGAILGTVPGRGRAWSS